jgi:hypothetical protein
MTHTLAGLAPAAPDGLGCCQAPPRARWPCAGAPVPAAQPRAHAGRAARSRRRSGGRRGPQRARFSATGGAALHLQQLQRATRRTRAHAPARRHDMTTARLRCRACAARRPSLPPVDERKRESATCDTCLLLIPAAPLFAARPCARARSRLVRLGEPRADLRYLCGGVASALAHARLQHALRFGLLGRVVAHHVRRLVLAVRHAALQPLLREAQQAEHNLAAAVHCTQATERAAASLRARRRERCSAHAPAAGPAPRQSRAPLPQPCRCTPAGCERRSEASALSRRRAGSCAARSALRAGACAAGACAAGAWRLARQRQRRHHCLRV